MTTSLQAAVAALVPDLDVDEERDVVRWTPSSGGRSETGLHDYAALYSVPGLYEAVYADRLQARSPELLAGLLADTLPQLPALTVLDVGCGTGAVGSELRAVGAGRVVGVDLEPMVEVAVPRDRPGAYAEVRALDLLALTDGQRTWLEELAPDVVTCVAAVGFGHLPLGAFEVLTELLRPGGHLAVTVARDLQADPALRDYAALLGGPAYAQVGSRDGVHRITVDGRALLVTALVLRRR